MAYFKDAQEVYDTLGKLFQDLVTDDELAPKLRQPVFPRYKAQLERQGLTDLIDA